MVFTGQKTQPTVSKYCMKEKYRPGHRKFSEKKNSEI